MTGWTRTTLKARTHRPAPPHPEPTTPARMTIAAILTALDTPEKAIEREQIANWHNRPLSILPQPQQATQLLDRHFASMTDTERADHEQAHHDRQHRYWEATHPDHVEARDRARATIDAAWATIDQETSG